MDQPVTINVRILGVVWEVIRTRTGRAMELFVTREDAEQYATAYNEVVRYPALSVRYKRSFVVTGL